MRNSRSEKLTGFDLSRERAAELAGILLRCTQTEYPNYPAHLMLSQNDVRSPKQLHPAFFGCYDWHSAVHSHWSLVHLLNLDLLAQEDETRAVLASHLSSENILAERAYMEAPERKGFERPYGWAWLLTLAGELATARTEELRLLARNLAPLEQLVVDRLADYLTKIGEPNRSGLHGNTAFSLGLVWDYADRVRNGMLLEIVEETSSCLYGSYDRATLSSEPGPTDFLSPSLVQADLMRRVLIQDEYAPWLIHYLGDFDFRSLKPAVPEDRSDGALCHLDGLNLSRAWCMRNMAETLGSSHALYEPLVTCALAHAQAGLDHVASGFYVGEHWLPTFAVYLLRRAIA